MVSCKQSQVVFDVPPLVGKNIDEVTKILGGNRKQLAASEDTLKSYSYSPYVKNGYTLNITYNPQTRNVYEFLIATQDMGFNDLEDMLEIGNLDSTSRNYWIETDRSFNFLNNYSNVTVYPK